MLNAAARRGGVAGEPIHRDLRRAPPRRTLAGLSFVAGVVALLHHQRLRAGLPRSLVLPGRTVSPQICPACVQKLLARASNPTRRRVIAEGMVRFGRPSLPRRPRWPGVTRRVNDVFDNAGIPRSHADRERRLVQAAHVRPVPLDGSSSKLTFREADRASSPGRCRDPARPK